MSQPLLELRGVNKSFGVVHVLHDVDFAVYPGQVTALVGDNGAGKSTLVKIIAGIYGRDSGDFYFDGQQVAGLSGGQRQSVAIGRAVMWNSKIVILDEPTAALGVAQTRQVLDLVRRLAEQGLSVVLVSHNLHDIFEVADRITVLRLGRNVTIFERSATTQQEVVHAITAGIPTKVPGIAGTDTEAGE